MKISALALALALAPATADLSLDQAVKVSFSSYKQAFSKVYADVEAEAKALKNFAVSLERVALRNEREGTETAGLTKFSDLSPEEFKATYLNRKARVSELPMYDASDCPAEALFPEHCVEGFSNSTKSKGFDWTTMGAVTPVKDQGQCGSCWAFGTTGDVEGVTFLSTKKLVSLSEQQIVSCDTKGDDAGCNGGLAEDAFQYIIKAGGLVTEKEYPYTSGNGADGKCKKNKAKAPFAASIKKWSQIAKGAKDEAKMKTQLAKVGPITIGINAGPMQDYNGGVDNPSDCDPDGTDHQVLIVGYGTDKGVDYWKIKNSWATSWGEKGYYRIKSGVNKCGLATDAVHSSA